MAKFQVQTTETVHRQYTVEATDEKHARSRLRLFFADADMLREGLVERQGGEKLQHRRVTGAKALSEPRAQEAKPGEKG